MSSVAAVLVALLLSADPESARTTAASQATVPSHGSRAATAAPSASTTPAAPPVASPLLVGLPAPGTAPKKPAAKGSAPKSKAAAPAVAAAETAPAAAEPAPPPAPAPTAAPPIEEDRLLVEQKCGKCHDISLAFSAQLSDAHWNVHMKRMASRPGAAITEEQARRIHAYLRAIAPKR